MFFNKIKKKNKIIIFDLDGVLINSLPNMRKALSLTSTALKMKLPFKLYKKFLGLPFDQIMKNMRIYDDTKKIHEYYEFYSLKYLESIRIKKKFLKELRILKKNFILAIFTSKSKKRTKKILSKYKMFDYCVTIDDVKKGKPMPEGLQKILKRFNLKKGNAVYIGDSIYDFQSAKRAGIKYLHAKWGYNNSKKTKNFTHISSLISAKKFF